LKALNLPDSVTTSIARLGNLGIAKGTWSTYKTARTMCEMCQRDTNFDLTLPFDQRKALFFINWLATVRKIKGSTINAYLAGIRQLHVVQGIEPPNFRTGMVKLVLTGITNNDNVQKRTAGQIGRLPMTINMMLILKTLIARQKYSNHDKRLLWAVSTIAFAGAFRIGELLAKTRATFDPNFTLLSRDLTSSADATGKVTLHVTLKCPKESKNAAPTVVDIYQNDGPLCPVKAFLTWSKLTIREPEMPLFREKSGMALTGVKMNNIIRKLLDPYTDLSIGHFGTHSFRIGLASMLGKHGFSDENVKESGRWSSRAFEAYMKLKRTKRAIVGTQISHLISQVLHHITSHLLPRLRIRITSMQIRIRTLLFTLIRVRIRIRIRIQAIL